MTALAAEQLPWLTPALTQLTQLATQSHLAHALLITGMAGSGKQILAETLCAFLLCKTPLKQQACGQCKSCLLLAAGNHADKLQINTENSSIGVDEIRQLIDFTHGSAQQSGNKVILIPQAERMTEAAANALLKTLEEPPQGCYLLLQTAQPQRLKMTLLSRCQRWDLPIISEDNLTAWLALHFQGEIPAFIYRYSGGAAIKALDLLQSGEAGKIAHIIDQLEGYISGKVELTPLVKVLESRTDIREILGYFFNVLAKQAFSLQPERQQLLQKRYYQWCRDELQILGQNKTLALSALFLAVKALLTPKDRG